MKPHWQGVFPAVTTQFRQDQSLDLDATAKHFEAIVAAGVQGLVVCGSLGENQTLTFDEKLSVVKTALEVSRGRVQVLSGVAELSTAVACRYAQAVEAAGAQGAMVMPAMVYKADAREAMTYFRTVAKSIRLPWMLYNNPIAYPVDITPHHFKELADIDNLVAIKESSANTRRITELRLAVGDRFALFAGVDDLILECAILGIDGWIAGTGIAFPKENQRIWDLTRAGKWDEARKLFQWSQPLMKLDTHVKFVQYIKLCVQEFGLGKEWVREPRLPLSGQEREEVLAIIRHGIKTRPVI
ncbi:MAG TPA: dihydrodipicolinate synthase family protein [Planctomycetaceae bacterium]|nr:dihydrodipicolinate synthase family protein [Planctomycetaceae bacterium]